MKAKNNFSIEEMYNGKFQKAFRRKLHKFLKWRIFKFWGMNEQKNLINQESVNSEVKVKKQPKQETKESWKKSFEWLDFNEEGLMICIICREVQINRSEESEFINGCRTLKRESAERHLNSKFHQASLALKIKKNEEPKIISRMFDKRIEID
jgi:hypothetical protein